MTNHWHRELRPTLPRSEGAHMRSMRQLFVTRLPWILLGGMLALLAWGVAPWIEQRTSGQSAVMRPVTPRGTLAADEQATIQLFEQAKGSVVYIATHQVVRNRLTRDVFNIPQGTGSGFVWDDRGHIVTNFHVLQGAGGARVRLDDGTEWDAGLVGVSPAHDLAVLHIDVGTHPPPVPVGTSQDLLVGQKVYAIGNPFGLDWTLTTGVVSALNRSLPAADGVSLIEGLIQTDAAINPGNSGGPLLDSAGRLIGVNTAIYSPSGAYAGVGFAVPVDTVGRVVPQLIARGRYVRPALGIGIDEDWNRVITRQLGVQGVVVLRVDAGTAAAAAGLREARFTPDGRIIPRDIITAINGQPIDGVPRLLARLDALNVGDTVRLTVLREGQLEEVMATLQAGG
jgi:S1-C subfamily serine protease